jgi:hypothetical protein
MAAGGGSILSETQQVCDVDLYGHLYDDDLDALAAALDRRLADLAERDGTGSTPSTCR